MHLAHIARFYLRYEVKTTSRPCVVALPRALRISSDTSSIIGQLGVLCRFSSLHHRLFSINPALLWKKRWGFGSRLRLMIVQINA